MTNTSNLDLERPDKGDANWHTSLNSNFTKLDTGYGNNVATIADLPEVYIRTDTFNSTSGVTIILPNSVDAVNEYNVTITPTTRGAAIGDIYVTKTTSNFVVYCSEANTSDTFAAVIYYIGDVNSYGGSIYRRWYVSTDTSITDHSDNTDTGSLAWVLSQIGGSPATVELPGNKTYVLTANDVTSNDNIKLIFQEGAIIRPASGKTITIYSPDHIIAGKRQQIINTTDNSTNPMAFTVGGEVFPGWWYSSGYWNTAFNLSMDCLDGLGGIITLPTGELEIDSTWIVDVAGILIHGTGGIGNSHNADTEQNRGTTIVNKSGDEDAIKIGKGSTYLTDIVLRDFAVDGDSATATDGNGIVLDSYGYGPSGVSSVKIENISVHHVKHYGLYLNGNVFECSFYGMEFRYNEYGVYTDADTGNLAEISFTNCHFWRSTEYGFYRDTNVLNVSFHGCQFGLNDKGLRTPGYSIISGCRFEQNTTTGIEIIGNGTIINGVFIDNSTTGIDHQTAGGAVISGVSFYNNTTDINIGSGAYGTILNGLYEQDGNLVVTNASRSTIFQDANYEILTETGAAETWGITELNSTSGAMAITLANGTAIGQQKRFYFITDGGDVTLTVAKHQGASNVDFTFTDAGNYLVFEWSYVTYGWVTINNSGVTI